MSFFKRATEEDPLGHVPDTSNSDQELLSMFNETMGGGLPKGRSKKTPEQLKAEKERQFGLRLRSRPMAESEIAAKPKEELPTTTEQLRRAIHEMSEAKSTPTWMGDFNNSTARKIRSNPNAEWTDEERARAQHEIETNKSEMGPSGEAMHARTHEETKSEKEKRLKATETMGPYQDLMGNPLREMTREERRHEYRKNEDANPIRIPAPTGSNGQFNARLDSTGGRSKQMHDELFAQRDKPLYYPHTPDSAHECEECINAKKKGTTLDHKDHVGKPNFTKPTPIEVGDVVTLDNSDGGVQGLGKGVKNIGICTGISTYQPSVAKVLSEHAIKEHERLCTHPKKPGDPEGTWDGDPRVTSEFTGKKSVLTDEAIKSHSTLCDHRLPIDSERTFARTPSGGSQLLEHDPKCLAKNEVEGRKTLQHNPACPLGFHDTHCGNPEDTNFGHLQHHPDCALSGMVQTQSDSEVPGRTLGTFALLAQKPEREQQYGKSKINFDRFTQEEEEDVPKDQEGNRLREPEYRVNSVEPEVKPAGMGGVQRGVTADVRRAVHVPSPAAPKFLETGEKTGKANLRQWFRPVFGDSTDSYIGRRKTTASYVSSMPNPLSQIDAPGNKLRTLPGVKHIIDQLKARQKDPSLANQPIENATADYVKRTEPSGSVDDMFADLEAEHGPKSSHVHVDEQFPKAPPCRFCDDPGTSAKGDVVQTSTATDGRPLYAHKGCEPDPFDFANSFRTL